MKIGQQRHRRGRPNLTPLVDVIFLLVIFFVASSSFLASSKLRLSEPAADNGAESGSGAGQPTASYRLLVSPVGSRNVRINGALYPVDEIVAVLNGFADRGVRSAMISPADTATVQDLATVIEHVRQSRIERVALWPR